MDLAYTTGHHIAKILVSPSIELRLTQIWQAALDGGLVA